MATTDQYHRKQLNFGLLLLVSFAIFNLGLVIDETVRWSNHFEGFMNGVSHAVVFGLVWFVTVLPWSLLVFGIYRWRGWKRFRSHWVLAPAILVLMLLLSALVTDPPSPPHRFRKFAKTELPKNVQNLSVRFAGGGFADYTDIYYFQTTPEEVERLIREMDLHLDRGESSYTPVPSLPGCPKISLWTEVQQYRRDDKDSGWFYYLHTDSSKTQVYILIGCI